MLIGSRNLTQPNSTISPADTHKGQAHFADLSIGETCGKCSHHVQRTGAGTKLYCRKAADLSRTWMQAVPKSAVACKYFERAVKGVGR